MFDVLLARGLFHPAADAWRAGRRQGVPQLIRGEGYRGYVFQAWVLKVCTL